MTGRWIVASTVALAVGAGPAWAQQSAVHYYPGTDVVQITVTETVTATKTVEDTGTKFTLNRKTTTKREGAVALKTVADVTNERTIDLQTKGLADTSFAVELSEEGLLRSVNLSSTGRFGDFLTSIAKFAGAAFVFAGLATPDAAVPPPCNGHAPEFAFLPVNGRYFIEQNPGACDMVKQIVTTRETLQKREKELKDAEDQLSTATDLAGLQKRIVGLRTSREDGSRMLAARSQTFAGALKSFEEDEELGKVPVSTTTRTEILKLTDLLTETATVSPITDGATVAEVETALATHKEALAAFKRSRVTVMVEALPEMGSSGKTDGNSEGNDKVAVCYRQSLPLSMRVFLLKSAVEEDNQAPGAQPPAAKVREVSHTIENVLHPDIPLSCPTFKASAFADKKLALTFDAKGRPQKVDRQTKSDAAAIAAGLANAATSFRDEVAGTLKKVEEIQESRRNISLDDLTTRLERLKKEKDVVDARLQVEAANATFETSLKQQQLAADLDAVNAEISLASAQDARAQKAEIDQLKLAIEQVQKSIELVKAQRDLDQLKKGSGS